jgi:hypothetical protein
VLGNDDIDRLENVEALREEKEGGQIRHTLQDRAWHPYISLAGFIWGGAIAAFSPGRQSSAECERSSRLPVIIGLNIL